MAHLIKIKLVLQSNFMHSDKINFLQNGHSTNVVSKMDQFRRSHSVRNVTTSSNDETRQKWSAKTMPKSMAAITSKNRKNGKTEKDDSQVRIRIKEVADQLPDSPQCPKNRNII